MRFKILLIEDDETFFDCTLMMLSDRKDIDVVWANTDARGIKLYQQDPQAYAVVILDYLLPDFKGTEVCQHLRRINSDQEFLFASGHSDPAYLLDQLETGSSGFLVKGSPIAEMKNKILSSVLKYQTKNRLLNNSGFEPSKSELELKQQGFISRSPLMFQMLKEIDAAKNSPYPTLIIGETGTGKELIAQALVPKGKKMISINYASFLQRENLLESELFGYIKGAFTGANTDTVGLISKANHNVLFLDELHQLPLSAHNFSTWYKQKPSLELGYQGFIEKCQNNFSLDLIGGNENVCEKIIAQYLTEEKIKIVLDEGMPDADNPKVAYESYNSWYIRDKSCIQRITGRPVEILKLIADKTYWLADADFANNRSDAIIDLFLSAIARTDSSLNLELFSKINSLSEDFSKKNEVDVEDKKYRTGYIISKISESYKRCEDKVAIKKRMANFVADHQQSSKFSNIRDDLAKIKFFLRK